MLMSSLSPRTKLTIMSDSDFVNPSVVDGNATKLDTITSVAQALAASRPIPPIDGQHIYETDTQNFRRYDLPSTSWHLLGSGPNGSAAQGLIGSFSNTSAATFAGSGVGSSGTQVVSLLDYNFTVKANRYYKIIEQGWFSLTGTYNASISNYWAELYSIINVGSLPPLNNTLAIHYIKNYYMSVKIGARVPYYKVMYYSGAAGTLYMRSLFRGFAANSQNFGKPADAIGAYAWAFDMGPNGSSY